MKDKVKMTATPLKNITQISADQFHAVMDDLQVFIHRVATDKNASPEEVAALPAIVKEIFNLPIEDMFRPLPSYPSLYTYNPFSTYPYDKETR